MSESATQAPPEAIAVLQKFLDAGLKKDVETMKACLSKATLASGSFNDAGQEGVRFELGEATPEGDNWVIPVTAVPLELPPGVDAPPAMVLPAIMIIEDGTWKFDLAATMERMMGGFTAAMEQVGTAMGQAMEGLGNAMSQAFGDSSSAPIKWLEADASYQSAELFPLPEMSPLPKLEASLGAICRHPVKTGVATKDLLKQVYSDDAQTLMDWFDDSLFAGWTSMLALLANRYPYIRRLQGFRIEAAKSDEHRLLILDGNDLVYRICIDRKSGYYSDDDANQLLPGILAGLPEEPDSALLGQRTLHTDDEPADLELFKKHYVPRYMRRICELLGKEVTLEVTGGGWDDAFRPEEDTRQYIRWSLNRIYGALALACFDVRRKARLQQEFHAIKITIVFNIGDLAAKYADGILEVSLNFIPGETGCLYEKDLLGVLDGEVIENITAEEPAAETEALKNDDDADENDADDDEDSDEDDEEQDDELDETDDDDEDEEDDDEAELSAEAKAKKLNDENFRTAAIGLKENESIWAMQLTYVFGHEAAVELDFDSLAGDYALVQPFIHQGLTAVLGALPQAVMEKILPDDLVQQCQKVIIGGTTDPTCTAEFTDAALHVTVPLQLGDVRPPQANVLAALRHMTAIAPSAAQEAPPETAAHQNPADTSNEDHSPHAEAHRSGTDPYAKAAAFMQNLESALKESNLWPGDPPPGDLEVRGAFGSENMAFTQWLAWILIPRVNDIIQTRGSFPNGSQVATYATREFDGCHEAGPVLNVLRAFDKMINKLQ